MDEPPLCVDLDGTLINGDTLHLSVGQLARQAPWLLALLPLVLLRGRPALKRFVALRYRPDPASLPWRTDVLAFLSEERARGRRIYLATAADRLIAESVVEHLGLFDGLIATDHGRNVKGAAKAAELRNVLQCNAFDYIGDSRADLPIFRAARYSYLVCPTKEVREAAESYGNVNALFASQGSRS